MRSTLFSVLTLCLMLTACKVPKEIVQEEVSQKPAVDQKVDAIEERKKMEEMKDADVMEEETMEDHGGWVDQVGDPGQYTAYIDGVIGNGMESVLFFHASWCPYCVKNNALLEQWYGSEEFERSVYKIDFDTALELRKEFGVTGQDTFILVDGNGREVERVSFPSESALRGLLQ